MIDNFYSQNVSTDIQRCDVNSRKRVLQIVVLRIFSLVQKLNRDISVDKY